MNEALKNNYFVDVGLNILIKSLTDTSFRCPQRHSKLMWLLLMVWSWVMPDQQTVEHDRCIGANHSVRLAQSDCLKVVSQARTRSQCDMAYLRGDT